MITFPFYQNSFPTGGPVEISAWQFSAVIPCSNSSSRTSQVEASAITNRPSSIERSTDDPDSKPNSEANDLGIRKAKLLPHFCTWARMSRNLQELSLPNLGLCLQCVYGIRVRLSTKNPRPEGPGIAWFHFQVGNLNTCLHTRRVRRRPFCRLLGRRQSARRRLAARLPRLLRFAGPSGLPWLDR
jgi:hypothetical protein